jgi:hypothetical protein
MTLSKEKKQKLLIDYKTGKISDIKVIHPEDIDLPYEDSTPITGFVYRILNDKKNGSFIEVGSSHWKINNNTYVLEKEFGWKGVGIEIEEHFVESYNNNRESHCIHANALKFNWDEYLEKNNFEKTIDFLQIDVDDVVPNSNLLALLNIPLSRYKFNVICVEHTANMNPKYRNSRDAQIEILQANGYMLVASLFTDDWWIHKSLNLPVSTYSEISNAAYRHEVR